MLHALVLIGGFGAALAQQTPAYNGQLLIQPALTTNMCLTAANNSDGAEVSIQPCTGGALQEWTFSGGSITQSDKCLDVKDGNLNDGALLQVWTCASGSPNQQFSYNRWANKLTWSGNGKCLDLTDGNTSAGNHPQLWQCSDGSGNQIWNTGYMASQLPEKSQDGQYGLNNCFGGPSQVSNCQTLWLNSLMDFGFFAPPDPNSTVGATEEKAVAWFLQGVHSGRLIPAGTLQGAHFLRAKSYVQVTGIGDFTNLNILKGDGGGEYDNRGATGIGNPSGGIIYGNTFGDGTQYHEWTEFISDTQFCIRACIGPEAMVNCNHIYDIMGCDWNMPANYGPGFEECDSDDALPMGVYGTSTWSQGTSPTPDAHPAPSSSNCVQYPTITPAPVAKQSSMPRRGAKLRF